MFFFTVEYLRKIRIFTSSKPKTGDEIADLFKRFVVICLYFDIAPVGSDR